MTAVFRFRDFGGYRMASKTPKPAPQPTPNTTLSMALVARAANERLVPLEVELRHDGTQAWFTVSCPCGCDEGGVIVSLDPEALWLAAGLITAVERLSGLDHPRRTA